MAKEIIMPKFGFTQEESTIVAWLKQEGDRVEKGEPIAECTTDKVNMEIEAPEDGILGGIRYPAGATVPVTEIIAYVLQEGETLPEASAAAAPAAPAAEAVPAAPPRDDADAGEAGATPLARRIAEAEGRIHGLPPEQVHFHEVGALDSIVDIVGACIGLELLGKPRVLASPVIEGIGWVDCAHGRFPVPAPATLAILGARGIAVTQCDEPHELVTPTGAALLAEFAESFGPMEGLAAERIGFGLGTRENRTRPNVLRAILAVTAGKRAKPAGISSNKRAAALDWETDTVAVLETNLDDISAEILGGFVEKAFNAGALDVFHTPIQMKKNRPGVLLTVLCAESQADAFTELILRETSAFGVRRSVAERRKLRREIKSVKTRFGEIAVKLGLLNGKVVQAAPEYESCRKAAQRANAPLKTVYSAAVKALKPNL